MHKIGLYVFLARFRTLQAAKTIPRETLHDLKRPRLHGTSNSCLVQMLHSCVCVCARACVLVYMLAASTVGDIQEKYMREDADINED